MRWTKGYRSRRVIDRRGEGGGGGGPGVGGAFLLARLLPRLGVPGILLVLAVLCLFNVVGNRSFLAEGPGPAEVGQGHMDDPAAFVSFVLDDNQATWDQLFRERGAAYAPAEMVLFSGSTLSGCGRGTAEVGPFYCPRDQRVYIDLSFYRDLANRYGARGDFAQAYVIAHEVGHHVQRQIGDAGGDGRGNEASIRRELQADCLAGVWARSAASRGLLEVGDLEEGLGAAAAVGDDRLQEAATGTVRPETWTHGSAEDRMTWFRRGYDTGAPEGCADASPRG
ncbi:MAG: neutral zinc metallopeptidase [Myxococcota bacterium]